MCELTVRQDKMRKGHFFCVKFGIFAPQINFLFYSTIVKLSSQTHAFTYNDMSDNFTFVHKYKLGLRHDLETGCLKLTIGKCLGVLFFEADHNIL